MIFELIFFKNKKISLLKRFNNLADAKVIYSDLINQNISDIFFPKFYVVNQLERKMKPYQLYLILRKINKNNNITVLHLQELLVEESFFSYANNKRFIFLRYLKEILIPSLKQAYTINIIKNKIIIYQLGEIFDCILCKNKYDAIRFYNQLKKISIEKNINRYFFYRGEFKLRKNKTACFNDISLKFGIRREQLKKGKTRN